MIDLSAAKGSANVFCIEHLSATTSHGSSEGLVRPPPLLAFRVPPVWLDDALRRISGLASLPENWDSYGALPVDHSSILAAQKLLQSLARIAGVDRPLIAASPVGHAALSWEWDDSTRNLDLDVLPSGEVRYCFIDERDPAATREALTDNPHEIAQMLTQW